MNRLCYHYFIVIFILSCMFFQFGCGANSNGNSTPAKIKLGIDVLLEKKLDLISGKKVGLITNPTGVNRDGQPTIDLLFKQSQVKLIALFGPEHGIRGDIPGGKNVEQYQDQQTGLPVYSLYGKTRRPTPEMLKGLEVLIYDIQDIGSRAYTYIYTMAYAMEAARDHKIPFIVLDRPNPLGGVRVEGNVLDPKFSSFIGLYPIPQVYGMTVGELARFFNQEFKINCDLTIIPMEGWHRQMSWEETGLFWIPTSPHVPRAQTVYFVAATGGIGELNTISEGVGYPLPFELIGTPWMDGQKLAEELNRRNLPGVYFRPTFFRNYYLKFINEQCSGVQLHILDEKLFTPCEIQIHLLAGIKKLYPDQKFFDTPRIDMFDKAFGTDQIRQAIQNGVTAEKIIAEWQPQLENFKVKRKNYLLYP
ncbi:DUF1343 domain-containing protein [candidate division KSB1 bacterium]|nr:DUF1343 domain-containing protein [candidate division KSB1 bacterium]